MLESKRLAGRLRIEAGKLVVRWHEDSEDGYENDSIGSRARGAAFDLQSRIDLPGQSAWVQAVIVLWADFDQRSIERDKVAWVRGDQLATVLAARPTRHQGDSFERLTTATRKAVTTLRQGRALYDGSLNAERPGSALAPASCVVKRTRAENYALLGDAVLEGYAPDGVYDLDKPKGSPFVCPPSSHLLRSKEAATTGSRRSIAPHEASTGRRCPRASNVSNALSNVVVRMHDFRLR